MKLKAKYFFLTIVMIVHSILLFHYAFDSWLDCDEGQWAHVAERVADGEILHKQIKEHHPDYIHYVNAYALKLWGHDFKSLRYPLILISLLQTAAIFLTLYEQSLIISLIASICISSFGFILVLNPTPNLYALFFHILIFSIISTNCENKVKYLSIGFLLASEFLFRQLSAVYTGLAIFCCLTHEEIDKKNHQKLVGLFLFISLILHVIDIANSSGIILFCISPIIVMYFSIYSGKDFWKRSTLISCGFLLGLIPQLIDLISKGNLFDWYNEVIISANLEINNFIQLKQRSFYYDILGGLNSILNIHTLRAKVNGIFLLFLPLLPLIQTARAIYLWKEIKQIKKLKNLVVFATFFSLVPAFNQVPLYLKTIAGLNLCALAVTELVLKTRHKTWISVFAIFICGIGILNFAGESTMRSLNQQMHGEWIKLEKSNLLNFSLNIEAERIKKYGELKTKVDALSSATDPIVAMPFIPYLYFILNRKNPTPWIGIDYAELGGESRSSLLDNIKSSNPKLIIYCEQCCSYIDNDESETKSWLLQNYKFAEQVGEYKIYIPN